MQLILSFIAGLILSGIVAYLVFIKVRVGLCSGLENENRRLDLDLQNLQGKCDSKDQEIRSLQGDCAKFQSNISALQERIDSLKLQAQKSEENFRQRENDILRLETLAKEEREKNFKEQLQLMESKFEAASQKLLKERTVELADANKENVENITKPFLKELEELRKAIGASKEGNDKNISALEATIKTVLEQSKMMGETTANLAEALKNRGKVQGDWGEQVLANILRESGLREGSEYYLQKNVKGEAGNDLRPDVIVHCADGSNIIIDSKVSLTAYCDYTAAEDDATREIASKENLNSIWKHVTELSKKNYEKVVGHAVPMVFMFVPNEGSYVLAMNRDPQVLQRAFNEGVVIINPTNLMLALNLVAKTWNNTRQEENCRAILKAAEAIYEKYCIFSEKMAKVGGCIESLQKTYGDSLKTLNEGKGNLSSQISGLLGLGVSSTRKIDSKIVSEFEALPEH